MVFQKSKTGNVSETSRFKRNSTWNPPKGVPALELKERKGYFVDTVKKGY